MVKCFRDVALGTTIRRTGAQRVLLLVLCAAVVAGAGPACADESAHTLRVARLIRQLAAPSYAARREADIQLSRLGSAAREQLRHALTAEDAEVRLRARQLLGRLHVEGLWSGSRWHAPGHPLPARELLHQLARETGNRVTSGFGGRGVNNVPVTLAGEFDFWSALDEICRQSQNCVYAGEDLPGDRVVIVRGTPDPRPRCVQGPVQLKLVAVGDHAAAPDAPQAAPDDGRRLDLLLQWEPRLHLLACWERPHVDTCIDAAGRRLHAETATSNWHACLPDRQRFEVTLALPAGTAEGDKPKELALRWAMVAADEYTTLRIVRPTAGRGYRQDDVGVVVQRLESAPNGLRKLVLDVTRTAALPEFPELLLEEIEVEPQSLNGPPPQLLHRHHQLIGETVRVHLHLKTQQADESLALRVHYPRLRSYRELTFRFGSREE